MSNKPPREISSKPKLP